MKTSWSYFWQSQLCPKTAVKIHVKIMISCPSVVLLIHGEAKQQQCMSMSRYVDRTACHWVKAWFGSIFEPLAGWPPPLTWGGCHWPVPQEGTRQPVTLIPLVTNLPMMPLAICDVHHVIKSKSDVKIRAVRNASIMQQEDDIQLTWVRCRINVQLRVLVILTVLAHPTALHPSKVN